MILENPQQVFTKMLHISTDPEYVGFVGILTNFDFKLPFYIRVGFAYSRNKYKFQFLTLQFPPGWSSTEQDLYLSSIVPSDLLLTQHPVQGRKQ